MAFLKNKEHNTPAGKITNREYMMSHLRATDMRVANTYFQKLEKLKVTYQKKDNTDGGPPWNTDRFCELDHCLVRRQWMNSIIYVRADPYTNINTDRRSMGTKIRKNRKAREKPNGEQSPEGIKPEKEGMTNEDAIREYNAKFRELVEGAWGAEETEDACFSNP